MTSPAVLDWLLDSDPAIRWQVLRDVVHAPESEVVAERARVAREGWGARLLDLQDETGHWAGGGALFPAVRVDTEHQAWTAASFSLQLLREFGVDPADERVVKAIGLVRANVRWEYDDLPYFEGEVEECINGRALADAVYFGQGGDGIAERLLEGQMDDGGWNCERENGSVRSSVHSTLSVLEGLLAYERAVGGRAGGGRADVAAARERAHEYLLDRRLMRRLSTGVIPDDRWLRFAYPHLWRYDVLRALDYLRDARVPVDDRWDEALDLLESKRDADGRWPLDLTHPGDVHFTMEEGEGQPSRWITLQALRVLEWARPE